MKAKIIAVLCMAACASLIAGPDKVTLKSGSFLTGKAGALTGDELAFESDDLGEIKIKIANIATLEAEGDHVIAYRDGTKRSAAVGVENGAYTLDGKPLGMDNVAAIDPVEPPAETWHGSVNLAYESTRGNSYKNSATLLANASRRWEKDRVNFNFGYYYSETGTSRENREKTTDRWEIEGQEDHFWSAAFYNYVNAKYERDDIAGLDYRVRLGAGLGYQWLDKSVWDATGTWSFNQEVGGAWVRNSFRDRDPDADDSYATVRYAHHLTYIPRWSEGLECFHNLEYLPQVDDWQNFLMKSDIGFSTKIIMNIDLLAKIEWDYNSNPSVGRKSSDTRYIVGLGYKW